jgi:hypothetical protein
MICHDKDNIRPLESKLLKSKHLKKIEDEEPEEAKKEQGNRPREYRIATTRDILNTAVYHTLNDNRKLWDMIIVFGPKGWVSLTNDEPIKSINALAPSASEEQSPIEKGEPIAVGDSVYVVYKEDKKSAPKVSGKVIRELKFYWEVRWDNWYPDGDPAIEKYKRYEVYKTKNSVN